uniref:Leukotriene A4 hydrolase n=1 Tax=Cyprinus carpio TaxID=7962 RepID=A0A8C2HEV7_CYPCA
MAPVSDPSSFSSLSKCATKHLNLIYHVDFDRHVLKGKVALTVEVLEDKFASLTLDSKDLKIFKVSANGQAVQFALGTKHKFKGSPLEITLPFELSRGQHVIVEIEYETSPSATALQWLTPKQTAGKKHPYLFSQCQAIHCRTMVPCQDTPSVKHTYYAQVSVPRELVALMSALRDGQEPDPSDSNRVIYRFRQPVPMPAYLIAIVVGALESREIGPRSRVWSEKEYVDEAAFEFSETETMLKTAESLAGPYVWGQYDLLVLPPSFPYGGMENPCLTFVTPTVLAGDRSLAGVIAHEISHSWTGNLVTNRTWEHSWSVRHTEYADQIMQKRRFLYIIFFYFKMEPLPLSHVKKMQEVYQLNSVKNTEVRFRWLRICVRAHWEEAVPLALKMATEQGRMKFTRPLFREVYNFSKYSDEAVKTFKEHRAALHPVTAMMVAKDLKIDG